MTTSFNLRSLKRTPLAACLVAALVASGLAKAQTVSALTHSARISYAISPAHRIGAGQHLPQPFTLEHSATTDVVSSCLDDGGATTLRSVIAAAGNGDTIDLSGLACSTITLTQGQLAIPVGVGVSLTIVGPTPTPTGPALAIDANFTNRVFYSANYHGVLTINNLLLENGLVSAPVPAHFAFGGCIFSKGDVVLNNSVVNNCTISGVNAFGGGIASYGAVTLSNSIVSGNKAIATTTAASAERFAQAVGGGIYNYYAITVTNSTISGNQVIEGAIASATTYLVFNGGGIGISLAQYLDPRRNSLINSTISGNSAPGAGGAIYAKGYLSLTNTTVSGNSADVGAGVHANRAVDLTLQNSTIAFNTGTLIGGVYAPGTGTMTINSTIISNNTSTDPTFAADLGASAPITSAGLNNLIVTSDAAVTFSSPPLTVDPMLSPLADNGGPTKTHAMDLHSPVIGVGNNALALTTDQRGIGFPRSNAARTDIGAFEQQDRIFVDEFE